MTDALASSSICSTKRAMVFGTMRSAREFTSFVAPGLKFSCGNGLRIFHAGVAIEAPHGTAIITVHDYTE
jgi:hypothetical protein